MQDYRIAGNFVWCKFLYISYVPTVCENKNCENLNVQNFRDIKTSVWTLTCTTCGKLSLRSSNLLRDLLGSALAISPSIVIEVKRAYIKSHLRPLSSAACRVLVAKWSVWVWSGSATIRNYNVRKFILRAFWSDIRKFAPTKISRYTVY